LLFPIYTVSLVEFELSLKSVDDCWGGI
jgi:hypothetical protein